MLAYAVDVSEWPLLTTRPTSAVRDNMGLEATYTALARVVERRERFVCFIDARGAVSDPARRKCLMEFVRSHRALLDQYLLATAIVVGSSIERGVVTAALWLTPAPKTLRVFTEAEAARAWLQEMHRKAG
jgi:hypothetical protein